MAILRWDGKSSIRQLCFGNNTKCPFLEVPIMAYKIDDFVYDVESTIDTFGVNVEMEWSLGPKLKLLVEQGGDLTSQGAPTLGSTGLPGRLLHEDPSGRFKIIVARFPSGEPTPIHAHSRWGLECGISGRERFTVYKRLDDGSDDASSTLEVFSDHHIERGDLGYWYDSPRNIHRQWAEGEEPSCVVILMGGDGGRDGIFDVDRGIFRRS